MAVLLTTLPQRGRRPKNGRLHVPKTALLCSRIRAVTSIHRKTALEFVGDEPDDEKAPFTLNVAAKDVKRADAGTARGAAGPT